MDHILGVRHISSRCTRRLLTKSGNPIFETTIVECDNEYYCSHIIRRRSVQLPILGRRCRRWRLSDCWYRRRRSPLDQILWAMCHLWRRRQPGRAPLWLDIAKATTFVHHRPTTARCNGQCQSRDMNAQLGRCPPPDRPSPPMRLINNSIQIFLTE